MRKNRTDFLCSKSSFLGGAGSVLGLFGGLFDYNSSNDADGRAIASDWKCIGEDISDTVEENPPESMKG